MPPPVAGAFLAYSRHTVEYLEGIMDRPLVVHVNYAPYDIYIGRRVRNRPDLQPIGWGNPFHVGKHGSREEVMARYRDWIQTQPELLARLPELRGKVLGC
jgi:hypothetical protein